MQPNAVILTVCLLTMLRGSCYSQAQNSATHQASTKTVNIGLLIQDNKSLSARYGAEMAIEKANAAGGLNGIPFQLDVMSMEGPWGTGSKQAVDLIFQKNVVAMLGSNDGRNAHLVEQVAAKTRVVFISAWSGDPTLAQAFVPWYFNCVPNYNQQADILINEIYKNNNIKLLAVLSDSTYDSKLAMECFRNRLKLAGKPEPVVFYYNNAGAEVNNAAEKLINSHADAMVLFSQSDAFLKITDIIKQKKSDMRVFGSLSVMSEREFDEKEWKSLENVVLISSGQWNTPRGLAFSREFYTKYGYNPGPAAVFAYDGMNILIKSLKNAGTSREDLQKYLKMNVFNGITGNIKFDDKGNSTGQARLFMVKNGIPTPVER
jgi:branched-chain amino acid transport system substrate-binding protein